MQETLRQDLYRTGSKLLEAVAYGDSAGLPVETLSAQKIRQRYGGLAELMPVNTHPHFCNLPATGYWSDDAQLSMALAESLIAADGFDIGAIAQAHVDAYQQTPRIPDKDQGVVPRGWGKATRTSVERLMAGVSPEISGDENAHGNGVIMKLSPLTFWQVARDVEDADRWQQYDQLTDMTHRNSISRLVTRIHGDVMVGLLKDSNFDATEVAIKHEGLLSAGNEISQQLEYLNKYPPENSEDVLLSTDKKGFYSPQTLAMAYGAFVLRTGDFTTDVFRAVNLGGDTDSIGSITASMLNFYHKGDIIWPDDIHSLNERSRLRKISRRLVEKSIGGIS